MNHATSSGINPCGSGPDRVETAAPVVVETSNPDISAVTSSINLGDHFTSRIAVITSSALTIVAYTLNWYSHVHGQPEYMPDWVLGLMWAPWGINAWQWVKDRFGKK